MCTATIFFLHELWKKITHEMCNFPCTNYENKLHMKSVIFPARIIIKKYTWNVSLFKLEEKKGFTLNYVFLHPSKIRIILHVLSNSCVKKRQLILCTLTIYTFSFIFSIDYSSLESQKTHIWAHTFLILKIRIIVEKQVLTIIKLNLFCDVHLQKCCRKRHESKKKNAQNASNVRREVRQGYFVGEDL